MDPQPGSRNAARPGEARDAHGAPNTLDALDTLVTLAAYHAVKGAPAPAAALRA